MRSLNFSQDQSEYLYLEWSTGERGKIKLRHEWDSQANQTYFSYTDYIVEGVDQITVTSPGTYTLTIRDDFWL